MLPGLKRSELGFLGVLRRFVSESTGCYPRNPHGGDRDEEKENVNVVVIGGSHFSVPTAEGLQAAAF